MNAPPRPTDPQGSPRKPERAPGRDPGAGTHRPEPGIARKCMSDRIRDELATRILADRYPEGHRLKELDLAAEFNVSQAPVREALRDLETLGLVVSERYRGKQVRGMKIDELREAYELRALIEMRSIDRAMPFPAATVERMKGRLIELNRLLGGDPDAYSAAFIDLHRQIVVAGGSQTLLATWDQFDWPVRGRIVFRRAFERGMDPGPALDHQRALVAAIDAGDAASAIQCLRDLYATIDEVLASTT